MVRTFGGIIVMKIGFDLFMQNPKSAITDIPTSGNSDLDPAFVHLAMPVMFGPGVLATVLGITSFKSSEEEIL